MTFSSISTKWRHENTSHGNEQKDIHTTAFVNRSSQTQRHAIHISKRLYEMRQTPFDNINLYIASGKKKWRNSYRRWHKSNQLFYLTKCLEVEQLLQPLANLTHEIHVTKTLFSDTFHYLLMPKFYFQPSKWLVFIVSTSLILSTFVKFISSFQGFINKMREKNTPTPLPRV